MTDTEHDELFEQLANDLRAMPARIKRAKEIEQQAVDAANRARGAQIAERAGHQAAIDEADAAHRAKCAEREHGLANREAAVSERERQVEVERQRVVERERWVEHRAADLTNRLRGAA